MSPLAVQQIPAYTRNYGGALRNPRLIVIHCGETPLARGVATGGGGGGYFQRQGLQTSAHRYFDPANSVQMVPLDRVAWHVGPGGNGISIGYEHAGRAAFGPDQWLSPDGSAMLDISAAQAAADALALGIPRRWLTLPQIASGQAGFCTHNDIRLALGGTDHSDIGVGFPYSEYMLRVLRAAGDVHTDTITPEAALLAGGDDMLYLTKTTTNGDTVFLSNGLVYRSVKDVNELQALQLFMTKFGNDATIQTQGNLDALGVAIPR